MVWANIIHVCDISRPAAITGSVHIIENRRGAHFKHNNIYECILKYKPIPGNIHYVRASVAVCSDNLNVRV